MKLITVFVVSSLWGVMGRRTIMMKPHRDVSTTQGTVRGYLTPTHAAYFGIPYARSPTRRDRYKAPEPPPIWDGIFEASHKVKCPQPGEDGDENCLVINIFAPRHVDPLPVYVLVHDGGFSTGWGTYEPPERFLKEKFVVVTFNYRLGALGFLCLNTPDTLGNAGLKDQIAALYWIHRNIEHFGGNPHEVIVHGVGSGAISIQLLLTSGLVDGLIHKVIVESGSALSPISMTYDPLSLAYRGAISIGYEGTISEEEMYKFYEAASTEELNNVQVTFLPCVEENEYSHSLINFDPIHKLKDGKYHKVPIMITYADTNGIPNITESLEKPPDSMADMMPENLAFNNDVIQEKIGQIVKEFYFGNDIFLTDDVEQIYFEYYYDIYVEYPIVKFAMLYAGNGPHMVYLMQFTQGSHTTTISNILDSLYYNYEEDIVYERAHTLWKNFINIGDPTPLTTSLIPVIWQSVVTDKRDTKAIANTQILHFDGTTLRVSPPPKNQRLLFWDNIYSKFYRSHITLKEEKTDDLYEEETDAQK